MTYRYNDLAIRKFWYRFSLGRKYYRESNHNQIDRGHLYRIISTLKQDRPKQESTHPYNGLPMGIVQMQMARQADDGERPL